MSFIQGVQAAVQNVSPSVQGGATAASILTALAAFLDKIHGPFATLSVIAGFIWLVVQIYLAIEKRVRKGKPD